MAGKATTGKDFRQDFSVPSHNSAEAIRKHEWNNSWYKFADSVSYSYALDHAYDAEKLIENQDLKNHLKATTLLSKSLKNEIDSVKAATELIRGDISHNFTKVPTARQRRVVESQVQTVLSEQLSINNKIDYLDSKGEKVSRTKCTPDLVLRNNHDDDTGNDGGDKVLQGETFDAAAMKSTIQTSQSQTTQSTHVSDSGIRTVRTLMQSYILTEEQILTGDQILMNDQILTPGHGQTLSTIPEGDEDMIIDNPEDASNLFQKFTTRDDNVDSNPDIAQGHDDSKILQEVDLLILSTVVDSHNREVEEEEEEVRRRRIIKSTDEDFQLYKQRLKISNKGLWRNVRRIQPYLQKSYAYEKEKDKKWKHISTLRCDTPINFQSGGIITSASSVVDLSDMVESKALWLRILSNLKQLTNNSRGGIGHRDAEYLNMPYLDPYSLTEIGGTLTSKHLNNLLVVDIVIDCHDGFEKKEKLLYFMKDGSVKILSIQDLLMKTTKELKYVHYMLKWKNEVYVWSDMILSTIRRRFLEGKNYTGDYTPMYLNLRDQDVEMQRGTAVKEIIFGMTQLNLNPDGKEIAYLLLEDQSLQRSSIQNLRAAIYQINEEDEELRNLKERLIQILEEKEENLLSNFLKMNLFYQRI
ncbi:hypothetical protein POM88_029191 [Heracleum sosnowskyi]|uniref:Uncharacterized protein n=1 Tax=Heracleum sosnowskyi TaxID=360622 RepID=A0AAD8HU83_9APIA|nr:hypothetical protein POM88_029191 [Heracleum sosnowskyi]